jgi:hypothetical protein
MMGMTMTVFWYDISGGIRIEGTYELGFIASNRSIFFAIRRFDLNLLYVVRWTNWTKKLDIKIRYIFLLISHF